MLTLTVVTATLSFNVLPLTLATAMLNVNVLPLKVATATVNAYMLTLTFATATLSFNVLPLTINVNVIGSVNSKIYIYFSVYLSSFIGLYVPFMSYIMAQNSRYFTGNCIWHYRKLVFITYLGSVVSLGQYR